ncbi:hypothetical protein HanXRQr2_Chr09g0384441 [Helianthus annuus]|uniref:Uncharacterized protein n=1 Tax=Helianthus annuus TaxID=4232 RepID=A0A9K3I5K3_HELAN|nr:hypothetical protein HanXRQr2_Chr09g0384441 [Helianthus annuus]KAJ0542137.1 hypothetical protein HanHA89_Chr09g0336501 [Helianthus annuus]KAJ0629563.1 hypothetical protein HanHA300_Chr00c0603g0789341 [Helianthus annuus]KAJ0707196.1 hypothetical protein HanLR1_Chr09g0315811 [Helianthus annuus]KAJ0711217.1 hypothetical protein HanOQP8_Chr09g0321391 [Helianthus annuus]
MDECMHVFKTFSSGFIKCRQVKEQCKAARTGCKEVVNRHVNILSQRHRGRAKRVDNEGSDLGR